MNTDIVFALADYRFYLTNITITRLEHFNVYRDHTHHCPAQVVESRSGTGPECCVTHHQRSPPDKAEEHASPLSNASSPAATRVPAMSADQSSTGKLVVPVRAWAVCSARAVRRLWCAVSIAGIGELCSAVSLRICVASLTPPSMAKPAVPSNLLCNILSPYETHL
jgi:hypothetical protein